MKTPCPPETLARFAHHPCSMCNVRRAPAQLVVNSSELYWEHYSPDHGRHRCERLMEGSLPRAGSVPPAIVNVWAETPKMQAYQVRLDRTPGGGQHPGPWAVRATGKVPGWLVNDRMTLSGVARSEGLTMSCLFETDGDCANHIGYDEAGRSGSHTYEVVPVMLVPVEAQS